MLAEELKRRGHASSICTTWSIDLPHADGEPPEADVVYVTTPVLFNSSAFELANRLVTLEAWNSKAAVINPIAPPPKYFQPQPHTETHTGTQTPPEPPITPSQKIRITAFLSLQHNNDSKDNMRWITHD